MFPRQQVVVFLILQNIISTFCDPVPLHVFSGDSENMSSDELLDYSRKYDGAMKNNILIVGPEALSKKNNFYESVEGNINEFDSENESNELDYIDEFDSENESNELNYIDEFDSENESNDIDYYEENFNNDENEHDNYIAYHEGNFHNDENEHDNYIDYYEDYFNNDENEQPQNNTEDNVHKNPNEFCPGEDYSLISYSDIKYLIEDKAETLIDKLFSSYYLDAEEVFKKLKQELEEFQKCFQERPEHLVHVLRRMTSLRTELESDVEELAAQLDQFEALEDNFNAAARASVVMLDQLEKYKKICHINREETETRFGHDIVSDLSIVVKSNGMYCTRLKHLNDYINEKLNAVEAEYNNNLSKPLDMRDKLYEQKILELESNLKDAAVKQFGMTMYDILSLFDDYHHFRSHLEHVNVSSEIYNIMENNAEISFKLIGLKRDLEKYRQFNCMKCGNARMKRHIPPAGIDEDINVTGEDAEDTFEDDDGDLSDISPEDSKDTSEDEDFYYPGEDYDTSEDEDIYYPGEDYDTSEEEDKLPHIPGKDPETDILSVDAAIDELIQSKIDEIKKSSESYLITIIAELDEIINDPDFINQYVKKLNPIQKTIEEMIKKEQEALLKLRNRVGESSINKILVLSKESKQMVQNLESAKQFIHNVII